MRFHEHGRITLTHDECPGPHKSAEGGGSTQEWTQRSRSYGVALEVGRPCIPKRRGNDKWLEVTLLKGQVRNGDQPRGSQLTFAQWKTCANTLMLTVSFRPT